MKPSRANTTEFLSIKSMAQTMSFKKLQVWQNHSTLETLKVKHNKIHKLPERFELSEIPLAPK
jgi:hypothetical protein